MLFYLDAHWNADLPLAEELEIIFARCSQAVVMIDDFQVADEPAYGFDDYGPANGLTLDYIAPALRKFNLFPFYPAIPASEETGSRRGCIVLAGEARQVEIIAALQLLRPVSPR